MTTPVRKRKPEYEAKRKRAPKRATGARSRGINVQTQTMSDRTVQALVNQRIGGQLGREVKFCDFNVAGTVMNNDNWTAALLDPTTPQCLNGVAMGDGPNQRDGRQYSILSVHIRGYCFVSSYKANINPIPDTMFRLALIHDKQTNGVQMDPLNVFVGTGGTSINGFRNLEYTQRFAVLEDMTFVKTGESQVSVANSFDNGLKLIPFVMNKSFKTPIKVQTTGSGATVASIIDNSLHLIGVANTEGGSVGQTRVSYWSRIRFVG